MDLIVKVAQDCGIDEKVVKQVYQSIFQNIAEELKIGETVRINKFGVFEVRTREARVGFNPRTREKLEIPEKQYPAFKPSKTLKDMF